MRIYRISSCNYITDISGKGAALYGGRWNNKNTYILYTAESRALALLEAVVHIGKVKDLGFCILTLELPGDLVEIYPQNELPSDWKKNPAPDHLKKIGDDFIKSNRKLALKLPSVIMEEESNILINPAHPDFIKIKIVGTKKIQIDNRLFYGNPQ